MAELEKQRRTKNWLHQRSGVARNTIDEWATQPRAPQVRTVVAVANALGIDEDEAIELAGIRSGRKPPVDDDGRVDLSDVSSDDLAAEVLRRMKR